MRRRSYGNRNTHSGVLIVCEGQTERLYFNNFKQEERIQGFNFKPECVGSKTDCLSIVKKAVGLMEKQRKSGNPYDFVYCIFDTDTVKENRDSYDKAKSLAKINNIKLIESYPCFEIWFLLHFVYSTASYSNCQDLKNYLQHSEYLKGYSTGSDYQDNLYHLLRDKMSVAIENATKLNKDIETKLKCDVYKIIEKFMPDNK